MCTEGLGMHVPADSQPEFLFMQEHRFRFLINGADTNGSYSALQFESPKDAGPPPHTHDEAEEHFLVLEGSLQFEVDGKVFVAEPGDFVHVPRRTTHSFTVVSSSAKVFASFTPAGEELGFIAAATPL
jgi:quercetin dioxygenase-like cupin family protein